MYNSIDYDMYLDCGRFSNCLLNVFGLWMMLCFIKYFVLVCVGFWKICKFKCGNNHKTKKLFEKNSILGIISYHNRGIKGIHGLSLDHNRGRKVFEF